MRPFPAPLAVAAGPAPATGGRPGPRPGPLPGPVTYQRDPQVLFASESLAQALRQLVVYGRDGLPVLSADGQQVQGWITNASVLHAVAREIGTPEPAAGRAPRRDGHSHPPGPPRAADPAARLPGPRGHHRRRLPGRRPGTRRHHLATRHGSRSPSSTTAGCRDPDPGLTLTPGDRINLLARAPQPSPPPLAHDMPGSDHDGQRPRIPGTP